jgi:hypothetical protein
MSEIDEVEQLLIRNCIYAERDYGINSQEYLRAFNSHCEYQNKKHKEWEDKTKEKLLWHYLQNRDELPLQTLFIARINEDLKKENKELKEKVIQLGGQL